MKRITLPLFCLFLSMNSYAQNPTYNISEQSNWNPNPATQYNDIWAYADCQDNEYAIIGSTLAIHFVDVTDPTSPAEVASFSGGESSSWRDIKTYRGHAYSVSDNTSEGLIIFNLNNLPQGIEQVYQSNTDFNSAQNIFIDEAYGRLYVVGSDVNDLLIFDLTINPAQPVLMASTSLMNGYIRDIYVRDNIAYASHLANGLTIYDCSDASNITIVGSISNYVGDVMNNSSWLSEDGNTLIFSDEIPGAKLKLMDVSDPSNLSVSPNHVFQSNLLGAGNNSLAHKPIIRDEFAFVSYYHDGLQVFDISNPDSIVRVAYLDTYPSNTNYDGIQGNWGLYPFLPSGNILASDINNGLFVMSMDLIELEPVINTNKVDAQVDLLSGPIICEGDSVLLVANEGDFTYLWTKDGEVLDINNHQFFAKETGSYQLEISNGVCSQISEIYEVTFNEKPDLSMMTGDVADICFGTSYAIEAPQGYDFYIWLKNGNALPNTNSMLMAVQSGTYSLIAYLNGCASTSAEYEINVIDIPIPSISAEETTICQGQVATIEAAIGAENYLWYYNNLLVAETSDNLFLAEQSGTYYVELQIGTCSETSAELAISVLEAPNNSIGVNGATTFCAGESVNLNAAQTTDIISWSWNLDSTEIGTAPTIEVDQNGQYELIVTSNNSCTATNTIDIEVIELEVPEVNFEGTGLISTAADTYQWYFNGEPIAGATDQFFQPETNGAYQVEITGEGCTVISAPLTFQVTSISTSESLSDLSIFPNPAHDFIRIDLASSLMSPLQVRLINTSGQSVSAITLAAARTYSEKIDLSALPSGVYVLQLQNDEGFIARKIVKE